MSGIRVRKEDTSMVLESQCEGVGSTRKQLEVSEEQWVLGDGGIGSGVSLCNLVQNWAHHGLLGNRDGEPSGGFVMDRPSGGQHSAVVLNGQ